MKTHDLIRMWKDRDYREGLTQEERANATNPVKHIGLSDDQLTNVVGGSVWGPTTAENVYGVNVCLPK